MASKKKHSEGIALLSVYSDEDDEEMEEEEEHRNQEQVERIEEDERLEESNFMDEERVRGEDSTTPKVLDNGADDDTSGESSDTLLDQFLPPPPRDKCSEELQNYQRTNPICKRKKLSVDK
ncbi:PREDICTED: histone chaperone ASF1-like isoform X1 [Brassica oleracea var. oleracea]|nr:PREDICTED: histone chaperone ASF1-like isoform X1 [Brassica oleracea var. oleracea]